MQRLLVFLLLLGCATGVPTGVVGVDRMGATVLRYRGPELELALSYRFATMSLGEDWLLLHVALTAAPGKLTAVKREKVFVLTPQGQRIELASQEEFSQAYSILLPTLRRAALAADPLDYFSRDLLCPLDFFAAPGEGLAFPEVQLDDRRVCQGTLFFRVPGGVQPGTWTLALDLQESRVRVPFTLAEP
jgi:hypothetical protein